MTKTTYRVKVTIIIAYLIYVLGTLTIWNNPEQNWELFIFSQTKFGLTLIYISEILGILSLILLMNRKWMSSKYSIVSIGLLFILCTLTIIYLWRIVSYYFITGMDLYNYMGMVKDIVQAGKLPQVNYPDYYPAHQITHVFITYSSSLSIYSSFVYFTGLIYIYSVIVIYVTLRRVFAVSYSWIITLLFMLISIPNFFGIFVYPYNQTYALMLFFGWVYAVVRLLERVNLIEILLTIVISSSIIIAHPIVATTLFLYMLSLVIVNTRKKVFITLFTSYAVVFILWNFYTSDAMARLTIRSFLIEYLFKYTSEDIALDWTQKAIQATTSVTRLILYTIITTFPIIAYGSLMIISIKKLLLDKTCISQSVCYKIKAILTISLIPFTAYALSPMISLVHNPVRLILANPFTIIIVLLATISIVQVYTSSEVHKTKPVLLSVYLIIIIFISTLNPVFEQELRVYPSQTKTWQEPIAIKFFEAYSNLWYDIFQIGSFTQIWSYTSKDLGFKNRYQVKKIEEESEIQDMKKNSYLFILRKDYLIYVNLYRGYRYTPNFFQGVNMILNRIYKNNEVDIYSKN